MPRRSRPSHRRWRDRSLARLRATLVAAVCLLSVAAPFAARAEVPRSTYLTDLRLDWSSLRRHADESDNFPLTWHADGYLYGAYGDGWGFERTAITKRAIGVSRIAGRPETLTGRDVWEGDAQGGGCCWAPWNGKSWGMVAVGSELHMWFTIGRPRALGFTEARIATSVDRGQSWRKADWAFTPGDGMLMPSFLQLGRGYDAAGAPADTADYVYAYHTRYVHHPAALQSPGAVMLMRVPKGRVRDRTEYRFYAGSTDAGVAQWADTPAAAVPVLEKPHLLDAPPGVSWNRHLGRFLMVMAHVPPEDPTRRGVAFYEAERPWGPWFEVKRLDQFAEGTIFYFQLPTKWMTADGGAVLAFCGPDATQEWDALTTMRIRFLARGGVP